MDWTTVSPTRDRLAESPLWHEAEQALYWTDWYGPTIHRKRWGEAQVESWTIPGETVLGSFVFARGGRRRRRGGPRWSRCRGIRVPVLRVPLSPQDGSSDGLGQRRARGRGGRPRQPPAGPGGGGDPGRAESPSQQ